MTSKERAIARVEAGFDSESNKLIAAVYSVISERGDDVLSMTDTVRDVAAELGQPQTLVRRFVNLLLSNGLLKFITVEVIDPAIPGQKVQRIVAEPVDDIDEVVANLIENANAVNDRAAKWQQRETDRKRKAADESAEKLRVERLRRATNKVRRYKDLLILNELHAKVAQFEIEQYKELIGKGITELVSPNTGDINQMIQTRIDRIAKLADTRKRYLEQLHKFETEVEVEHLL